MAVICLGVRVCWVILDSRQKNIEGFVAILRWELESRCDDFTMTVYGGLVAYSNREHLARQSINVYELLQLMYVLNSNWVQTIYCWKDCLIGLGTLTSV